MTVPDTFDFTNPEDTLKLFTLVQAIIQAADLFYLYQLVNTMNIFVCLGRYFKYFVF